MSPGTTQTVQVTANSLGGFAGKVYLSTFAYPPNVSLNQTDLTLSSGGQASATLTATLPASTPPINGTIIIEAVGGCSLFHEALVSVTDVGPDFTITPEKTHLTVTSSVPDSTKIDLASLHGFSGTVSLDAFSSEFTITPPFASVTLAPGGQGSTTMSFLAASTTAPGNYTVTIFGSSGSIFNYADIEVTVSGATFGLSANPPVLTLTAGGPTNSSTITVAPIGSFAGTVNLSPSPSFPSGLNVLPLSTNSVTLPPTQTSTLTVSAPLGTKPGHYFVDVSAVSGSITEDVTVSIRVKGPDFELTTTPFVLAVVAGDTAGCQSTVSDISIEGFSNSVGLTVKQDSGLSATLSNPSLPTVGSTSTLTVTAASNAVPGFHEVDLNGTSGILTHTDIVTIIVIGPDFEISANPPNLTITAGTSLTTSISLHAENGFTGTVSLHNTTYDPGITPTLSSSTISGTSTVTLNVAVASSVPPGDYYSIEVNATSGALVHPIFIPIIVVGPDFTITTDTNPVTFNAGSTATSTITINPKMSFSDPVDLFVSTSSDLNATINPTTVTSGSYTATLSLNSTRPGYYTVDVFGSTSSGLFHDLTIQVVVSGPDFSLSASPPSTTIAAGTSGSSTISVGTTLGFKGTIDLSSVFPPTGITATPAPAKITESQTSTIQITVDPSVAPGPYTIDIQGTSGSLKHDALITVNVASFSLAATSDVLTINQGSSGTTTVNVASINGFSNTVSLTTSPATGLTATIVPSSVTGSGPSTLTVHTNSVSPGTYQVNVTGTSGLLIQKVTVTVTVPAPDFTLAATSPASTPADGTTSATSTISFSPRNGFTGTVALTDTSLPAGLSCTAINPISISGSQTATLSCTSTTAKTYSVTITGTSTSLVHTITATFTFVDFTISASSPSSAPADGTTAATSTITVGATNGFSSTITLSDGTLPIGISCTAFTPLTVTGSGTATLACASTKAGSYSVTITGTSNTLVRTAFATFSFDSFTLSATSPTALDVGKSAVSTVTVSPANGFARAVVLSDNSLPTGLTCLAFSPVSVTGSGTSTLSCQAATAGSYKVTITGTSGTLVQTTTATFNFVDFTIAASTVTSVPADGTTQASSVITINSLNGFSGTLTLSQQSLPSGMSCTAFSPPTISGSGTSTIACTSTVATTYTMTITATDGYLTHTATATFQFTTPTPDFSVSATTPGATPADGTTSASSTISLTNRFGFTGTVYLTDDPIPLGLSCVAISPLQISGSQTATLSCTSTTAGTYTVTVTGTSGSLVRTATATFTFTDFSISASNPAAVNADGTTTATSTITVTAHNGFAGTVTLDDTPLPTGLLCTALTPSSVAGSGSATLTCHSSTAKSYTVNFKGTSGSLSHTASATFTFNPVASFSISSDHSTLSIQQGGSGTTTITVTPSGGFSGTVTLTDSVSPGGPTISLSSSTIISGSGTSILTINIASSVNTGTYTVTVTGGSGGQTSSATITVTVTAPQSTAPAPGSPTLIYAIVGVVIAAVAIGGGALYLRSKKSSKPAKLSKAP